MGKPEDLYIYIYMYVYVYIYVYVCICICIYTHTHTYINQGSRKLVDHDIIKAKMKITLAGRECQLSLKLDWRNIFQDFGFSKSLYS